MDIVSREKRSKLMSGIKGKNTKPEIIVRSLLFKMGYRFRIHVNNLPGKPDIVLHKHNIVIFVHGCFWHRHENCKFSYMPKSNVEFWINKFEKTLMNDQYNQIELNRSNWKVQIVWECQTRDRQVLEDTLLKFFK